MRTTGSSFAEALGVGAVAGVVGGLGEIGWIALYGAATGAQTGPVARGIVSSVIPGLAASSWSPWLGILIHLGLAIALGLSLALMVRPLARRGGARHFESGLVMFALAAVWVVNFFAVLPLINPGFIHLLPYGVTLLSKLLFGLSAATVFRAYRMRQLQVPHGG